MSIHTLIVRLEQAQAPDRRLDAEVLACLLGPPGAVLQTSEDLDGWGVDCAPDASGQAPVWMTASDVPGLTAFLDAAQAVAAAARPDDGAALMARALRRLDPPSAQETPSGYAGRAARAILTDLLRASVSAQASNPPTLRAA